MDQDTNYIILSNQCIIIELLYALMELGLALHEIIIPERQGMRQYLYIYNINIYSRNSLCIVVIFFPFQNITKYYL